MEINIRLGWSCLERHQKLAPIAAEMKRLAADPGHVDAILIDGAERARKIAHETMQKTKDIVGFVRKHDGR